jgi:transcriptional regulator with XRE-family HTH domain
MQITTGNEIKAGRLMRNIAMQSLADRMGIPLGDLRVIEKSSLLPSQEIINKACAVFNDFDNRHDQAA